MIRTLHLSKQELMRREVISTARGIVLNYLIKNFFADQLQTVVQLYADIGLTQFVCMLQKTDFDPEMARPKQCVIMLH